MCLLKYSFRRYLGVSGFSFLGWLVRIRRFYIFEGLLGGKWIRFEVLFLRGRLVFIIW